MTSQALWFNTVFKTITCYKCQITFAVDASIRARWIDTHEIWYCPNGHQQHYLGETEAQRLRKQLDAKERELQFARNNAASERAAREQTERRLTARKAVNTRLRNRIKHGVCPCCRRTFTNVAQHMKTQHPKFNKDDGE